MTNDFRRQLLDDGLLRNPQAAMTALTGGVSAEILLVNDTDTVFAAKRVLAKLRVQQDWYADISRVNTEISCLEFLETILPGAVPKLIATRPNNGYFLMEYLGPHFTNWKTQLLRGQCSQLHASKAGDMLGRMHRLTWGRNDLAERFNALQNFQQLRLDPYFSSLLHRHSNLRDTIERELYQLHTNRLCLIHGDYSPKNIMCSNDRMVVLDWEVAWYGDPSFDIGFLLSHLILKAVHRPAQSDDYLVLCQIAWQAYNAHIDRPMIELIDHRLSTLLPLLLLARVDGKSPVEYLARRQQEVVRSLVRATWETPFSGTMPMCMNWITHIKEWNNENHAY